MKKKKKMKLVACSQGKCNNGKKRNQTGENIFPEFRKWKHTAGNEMLIKDVLAPLLEIVYLYKDGSCYNYVPGTHEDSDAGYAYFEKRFCGIRRALDQNLYISYMEYHKAQRIVEEVHQFVRSFSGAEGLKERFFQVNPKLRFYRVAFDLREEDAEAYMLAVENGLLAYVPSERDFRQRKDYFSMKYKSASRMNLPYDKDDFFMQELAYTLRLMFLKDLTEYSKNCL